MTERDYQDIRNLVFAYAERLDSGDFDGLAQLFAHAEVHVGGQVLHSDPAALKKMFVDFVKIYEEGTPRTRHCISNVSVTLTSETEAVSSSYVIVFQQTKDLPLQPIIGGDYRDKFVKTGDGWRFSERRIGNDLFGNLGAHGKYAYGPNQ